MTAYTETSGFDLPADQNKYESADNLTLIYESRRGYSRIYSAVRNGRRVALKTLKPEYADTDVYRQMLQKEFEIGHRLYHPGIVSVLGFENIADVGPAIVMEYVDGITLKEHLDTHGSLTRNDALALLDQLCDALSYLHSHQLSHRDLKPANIMLSHSGRFVKLIDFGLSDGTAFVDYKYAGGTRNYSAPEQLTAGTDNDPRADIYSLGVIMNEICPKAGGHYRRISRLCRSDEPQQRPSAVADIIDGIHRATETKRRIFIASIFTIPTIVIAVLAWQLSLKEPTAPPPEPIVHTVNNIDTVIKVVHDTIKSEPSIDNTPATAPAVPAAQPSLTEGYISNQRIDSMIAYTRSYVLSELKRWETADSFRVKFFDSSKVFVALDRYTEQQCNGDLATIARVKPLITETASATMRDFFQKRRNHGESN